MLEDQIEIITIAAACTANEVCLFHNHFYLRSLLVIEGNPRPLPAVTQLNL